MSFRTLLKVAALGLAYLVVRALDVTAGTKRRLLVSLLVVSAALGAVLFLSGKSDERTSLERTRYDGKSAVEIVPASDQQIELVHEISEDVWSEQLQLGLPLVFVADAEALAVLESNHIAYDVLIEDIQAVADAERLRLESREPTIASADWFSEYRDVQEMFDYMDLLGERHSELASLRTIGNSIEGWPIRTIDISRGGDIDIVLTGTLHAREWISPMVNMCIAERLLEGQESDPRIRAILDEVSFAIAPMVNPDGYVYSWNVDRYWRKNRRGGHGVDLNRNFSVAFGKRGASGNRFSQTYRGKHAFSEPETQAVRRLFDGKDIEAHIDFHSFSQLILYPWNYQRAGSPDAAKFAAVADHMSSAMYAQHGKRYKLQSGADLYPASGTFSDWSYGEAGALSFTFELRPARGGRDGFVLPPEEITETCDESMAALLELAEWTIRDKRRDGRHVDGK